MTSKEEDLLALLKEGAMESDQIAGRLGWSSSAVLPVLTKLELTKRVRKKPNGVFVTA